MVLFELSSLFLTLSLDLFLLQAFPKFLLSYVNNPKKLSLAVINNKTFNT